MHGGAFGFDRTRAFREFDRHARLSVDQGDTHGEQTDATSCHEGLTALGPQATCCGGALVEHSTVISRWLTANRPVSAR
jgi:hypothetical protein